MFPKEGLHFHTSISFYNFPLSSLPGKLVFIFVFSFLVLWLCEAVLALLPTPSLAGAAPLPLCFHSTSRSGISEWTWILARSVCASLPLPSDCEFLEGRDGLSCFIVWIISAEYLSWHRVLVDYNGSVFKLQIQIELDKKSNITY